MDFRLRPPADGTNPSSFHFPSSTAAASSGPFLNAHRRAFSNFSADGQGPGSSAAAHQLSGNIFSPDDLAVLGYDDGQDNGDPKRRRIARACDMCRKKKIKCDGKMPACSHCMNYKTECIFTQVEKKRNPPKGAKYIEGLENRLGRMEQLLKLSGLLSDQDADATDLHTLEQKLVEKNAQMSKENGVSRDASPTSRESTSPTVETSGAAAIASASEKTNGHKPPENAPNGRKDEAVEALSEAMCSLVTNNYGDTRYIGIQWVNEKTGDRSFQEMVSTTSKDENKWVQWKPDVFRDVFQRTVYRPLPPRVEALSLLKDFFENFNCMFPLFHEPTFMQLVHKHYSNDPHEGSGWWASFNVALAIAHRLRVMSNLVPQEEDEKAWGYMKNALAVQTELTMRNTDLLSIQALLGMSMFLMGTPNPQPSFFMVAAAIRLAHSLGLHKRGSAQGMNPGEIEQRKRVFWIAYMLDKDICLRSGRPPIQDDDDMNVDLPSESPPDGIGNIPLAEGKGTVNLFRLMCTFALIASKVYKKLYSVKASKQSDGELLNTIGELDKELEDWKDGIPIDFRPEHEIKASHTPLMLHVVVLHFAYYNCLTTIHRMAVHHGYWTSRLSNYAIQGLNVRPLNPRVFSSAALCVSAARASINLIKYIPQGDFDCVWMVLYYPVSALVTLFANILQNPQDTRARSDLKLMNQVVEFVSMLSASEGSGAISHMLQICSEFERISQVVLDKSDRESHSRRKRKQQDAAAAAKTVSAGPLTPPPLPHMGLPTAPSQPGNIPNVFSPPPGLFLNANPTTGFADASLLSASAGASPPFLSPGPTNMATPLGSTSPLSVVSTPAAHASTPSFSFAAPVARMGGISLAGPVGPLSGGAVQQDAPMLDVGGGGFHHPFIPQDLWQMPMSLEWDWADMTSGFAGAGFEVNGGLNDITTNDGTER